MNYPIIASISLARSWSFFVTTFPALWVLSHISTVFHTLLQQGWWLALVIINKKFTWQKIPITKSSQLFIIKKGRPCSLPYKNPFLTNPLVARAILCFKIALGPKPPKPLNAHYLSVKRESSFEDSQYAKGGNYFYFAKILVILRINNSHIDYKNSLNSRNNAKCA